jgi:nitrite reductase/ring-hydroxylating ferredoxin subunit
MARIALCKTDEVAPGTAKKVETEGLSLAVFNLGGEFYVMDDLCSHGPGSLSEGYIEGEEIECDFHNGRFSIKTGEVRSPPCMIPQKVYPVTVEDGTVLIEHEA